MNKDKNRKTAGIVLRAVLAAAVVLTGLLTSGTRISDRIPDGAVRVLFFDVGQGDCTLIVSDGAVILVDVPLYRSDPVTGYLGRLRIRKIDWFVVTHFDSDHCGDAARILSSFNVAHLLMPEPADADDPLYREIVSAADPDTVVTAKAGQSFSPGAMTLDVLSPGSRGKTDNERSVVCRIAYGADSVLLCSDMGVSDEKTVLSKYGGSVSSDILKVGHHGSKYSSSPDFLKAVSPAWSVISCGQNRYGHPTLETLSALEDVGSEYIVTQANGVVIFDLFGDLVVRKK